APRRSEKKGFFARAWYRATDYTPREIRDIFFGKGELRTSRLKMNDKGEMDYTFLVIVILVVAAGLVMLLSASAPASKQIHGNSYTLFGKQAMFATVGFLGMYAASKINYNSYKSMMPTVMLICVVLLTLVLLPGTGKSLNGSKRWLNIPGISLQPSEFVKPVIAMYFAMIIEKNPTNLKRVMGNVPYVTVLATVLVLMLAETHLSGAIVIAGIAVMVLYFGGMPLKPIIAAAVVAVPVTVAVVYFFDPVRWARITSFIDPFSDMQNKGYQISQAIYAIGSGKIFGLGLGQSVQKYSYLPEPYNDFIFAVICEELGLFGALIVMVLFLALIMRGIKIALNAPDIYGTLVALGIVSQLAIQTILNLAVATSTIPNTGVSLPFFSYGGTSIMTLLIEMGILLNISRHSVKGN
ncbi:MAG: putative lipid II flippase FtsW, partial [Clostridiales bacterium]|nr:putative lipid II flippase FtsW [Clostridiales bacterium]